MIILPIVGELTSKRRSEECWTEIRALLRVDAGVGMGGFRCIGVTRDGRVFSTGYTEQNRLWKRKEIVEFVTIRSTGTREGDTS